jgi:hypothetical protein
MTSSKKTSPFTRRRFLVGAAGATMALPFLEGLQRPRRASAEDDRPRFAVWVRAGNGVQQAWDTEPESFWPRATGALTTAGMMATDSDRATSELAPFADRLTLLKGVNRPFGTPNCGHAESIPQCLTGAQVSPGTANDPRAMGQSADWRIVQQLGTSGTEPMTLMAGPSDAYIAEALSWRDANVRTPAERSPANQYMRMMGLTTAPPEIERQIAARRLSVNDLVREEMSALLSRSELSAWDRRRLSQHRDAIRDLELSTMACDLDPAIATRVGAMTSPESNDVRLEVVRLHMDLIAFAFSCDYVRAATLQVGEGNDQTTYEVAGSRLPRFHWISHRIYADGAEGETIPDAVSLHHQVDRLQLQTFAHLLEQLDSYDSAYGGKVLDDSVAVWLNDLGAGPPHSGNDVPWLLAGGCGGRLRTGQFLDVDVKINQVLNTILTAVGCTNDAGGPVDDFGDASLPGGQVDEIVI